MRQNSGISATAGNNGNGGNITINQPFIVAMPSENNDITANAFQGKGGKISIGTPGMFGISFKAQATPLTSDITASSQFGVSGTVQVNVQDIVRNCGLKGKVISADALHCNQATTKAIIKSQNNYLIALKKNQNKLYEQVKTLTNIIEPSSRCITKEQSHGREVTR